MSKRERGFTLVELLVVVAILGLLVSLLMPTLGRARQLARKTICQTNLSALGRGWMVYFQDWNSMTPQTHNTGKSTPDCLAQFNYMIYCGNPRHTVHSPDYVNAGVLYREGMVSGGKAYVCPEIERNYGQEWFTRGAAYLHYKHPSNRNPWPIVQTAGTYMTYGKRRFNNYDDPGLSYFPWSLPRPRPNDYLSFWASGVTIVETPSRFSFMTDRFETPGWAVMSHVPGINVQYLDGHVAYWQDPTWDEATGTGEVLYDNGIDGWGSAYNWKHDDVYMIIDGYHQPPLGQGK
jgi:prepilin-type N-terminal cleavage/methylation domain-containing protein/prepilin-type processing-associated H-X9-DG protein